MNNLVVFEGKLSGDVQQVVDRAQARVADCDSIVVVMQKKAGGMVWDGPDAATLKRTVFLLWSALMQLGKLG